VSRVRELSEALWASHRRLVAAAGSMGRDQLVSPSYCTDWTIAQVLSHIGSGAQIFGLLLDAALAGSDPPDRTAFSRVWDTWNAMTPQEQGRNGVSADAGFLQRVDAIPEDQLDALQMTLFGQPGDAARLLGMRLSEHAIHTWDVEVMANPSAILPEDAVDLIIDSVGQVAGRTGRTEPGPLNVAVITSDPVRRLRLSVSDAVTLSPADGDESGATLRLPAEALFRLVYGRLDPAHTPAAVAAEGGVDLNALRAVFPGF
jgi:uncharacterized protein (TIGR03083 family)